MLLLKCMRNRLGPDLPWITKQGLASVVNSMPSTVIPPNLVGCYGPKQKQWQTEGVFMPRGVGYYFCSTLLVLDLLRYLPHLCLQYSTKAGKTWLLLFLPLPDTWWCPNKAQRCHSCTNIPPVLGFGAIKLWLWLDLQMNKPLCIAVVEATNQFKVALTLMSDTY